MSVFSVSVTKCFLSDLFPSVLTFLNICLADLTDVWTEPKCFSCQCLSSKSNWCLLASVYRLMTSICLSWFFCFFSAKSEVIPNVLCQVCLRESDVFSDQPTTFLACLFLPMSVMRNLLMSIWTELVCFLVSIFLVSSIDVCLKCFPTSFAKSIWRDPLMSFWINPMSFLPVSVWWVWSVSVWPSSHLSLSANVCYEEPADVYLDWTQVFFLPVSI